MERFRERERMKRDQTDTRSSFHPLPTRVIKNGLHLTRNKRRLYLILVFLIYIKCNISIRDPLKPTDNDALSLRSFKLKPNQQNSVLSSSLPIKSFDTVLLCMEM